MKTPLSIATLIIIVISTLVFSCKKQEKFETKTEDTPTIDYSYNYESALFQGTEHVVTNAGARLGRVLFYDKKLSKNNMISCASCHKQSLAFADNIALSMGFNGGKTGRNSMAIINSVDSKGFFWDNRTENLKDMVLQPIRHEVEMGLDNPTFLIEKLNATSYYPQLFNEAFGSTTITKENIGEAMAQFIFSITSKNTKADEANLFNGFGGWNTNNTVFTVEESTGAQLFQSVGCDNCHFGANLRGWNDAGFENIGLDSVYSDKGMGNVFNNSQFDGVFKVPSLRNVSLTAPYMHDGRFKTLEEVVEHYNSGVNYSSSLSFLLKKYDPNTNQFLPEAKRLDLSENDKKCLVSFLKTLTDYSMVADPKYSNPFK